MLTTGTLTINVPHNLLHSDNTSTEVTFDYDIIRDDIQIYDSSMPLRVWIDIKDYRKWNAHAVSCVRAKHFPDVHQQHHAKIDWHMYSL